MDLWEVLILNAVLSALRFSLWHLNNQSIQQFGNTNWGLEQLIFSMLFFIFYTLWQLKRLLQNIFQIMEHVRPEFLLSGHIRLTPLPLTTNLYCVLGGNGFQQYRLCLHFLSFPHASSMALEGQCQLVRPSLWSRLIYLNYYGWIAMKLTFMVPKWFILVTLVIPWLLLCHHDTGISFCLANYRMCCHVVWYIRSCLPLRMNNNNFCVPLTFHLAPTSSQNFNVSNTLMFDYDQIPAKLLILPSAVFCVTRVGG